MTVAVVKEGERRRNERGELDTEVEEQEVEREDEGRRGAKKLTRNWIMAWMRTFIGP